MHFVLNAVYKVGLFESHGMPILCRWKKDVEKFDKGLVEGWYLCDWYSYDYSHVWGGTPTYQLPARLSGFEWWRRDLKKFDLHRAFTDSIGRKSKFPRRTDISAWKWKKGRTRRFPRQRKLKFVKT